MQIIVDRVQRQFQAVGDAELIEDIVQMVLHRQAADTEDLADFIVQLAGQRAGQVEAEAVHVHLRHPVDQALDDQVAARIDCSGA